MASLGSFRCSRNFGSIWKSVSIWRIRVQSSSSQDIGVLTPICGRNCYESLAGPACSPGRNCSRTFAALEKRNWQTTSQCTSSASGSATHNRSLQSTTSRSPTITSRKRCKKRCSNPPFCLARGRKAIWLSARKPLFCNGMRRIARRCQRGKLSSTAGTNPFRTSAMTTAASVCDGAAKSAFT